MNLPSFDAQCSELFLYYTIFKVIGTVLAMFRCSIFWAFSLSIVENTLDENYKLFRCSTFWAFSLSWKKLQPKDLRKCFDAQRFELFLYKIKRKYANTKWNKVSMLNVLSFFFMKLEAITSTCMWKFRCSMFWAFSLWS